MFAASQHIAMARRTVSWSSRVFSVELDKRGADALHFALREKATDLPRAPPEPPETFKHVFREHQCYSLFVCGHDDHDRVRSARLHRGLGETLRQELPAECELLAVHSYVPHVKNSLIRGYFLKDASESDSSTTRVLRGLHRSSERIKVCSYHHYHHHHQREGGGEEDLLQLRWWWSTPSSAGVDVSKTCCYVVPSEAPDYHPSVLNVANCDVFYCLEEAAKVLEEVCLYILSCSGLKCFVFVALGLGSLAPSRGREGNYTRHLF